MGVVDRGCELTERSFSRIGYYRYGVAYTVYGGIRGGQLLGIGYISIDFRLILGLMSFGRELLVVSAS